MKFDCLKVSGKLDYVKSEVPTKGGYTAKVSIGGAVIPNLEITSKLYEELEVGENVTLYGIFKNGKDKDKNTGILYGLMNQSGNKFFATNLRFSVPMIILVAAVIAAAFTFVVGWFATLLPLAWIYVKADGFYTLLTNVAIAEAALVGGFFVRRAWVMLKATSEPEQWGEIDPATLSSRFSKYHK
ncbi:hypothetical protein A0O30_08555 [Pseudomonas sp. LLC-1]|uniref:hypothetical protein n=1 Tax=Pseudomonas sp. LLC-1 TaxID=1812180 RepID=UPI000D01873E|nr:hypothetical protein [Pseudomonas sp. LLC-1]PRN05326.1 hypothetical protein A0O30_08555 [Pseudomonas sp. LLC-1]